MKSLIVFFLAALVFSCSSKVDLNEMEVAPEVALDDAAKQLADSPNVDLYSNGRAKLIKTVNYRFEVKSIKQSTEAIEAAIRKYPAYVSASDLRLDNPILENKMTIRVQSEFFQDLLKDIDQQASFVNYRDVKTEDVAKQFVDLESRLKTKREVEARYMDILRKKAGTIEELLQAEKQIGELHEEIESTISRINYLKDEVGYSTIHLEFYQTLSQQIASAHEVPLSHQFGNAIKTGWSVLISIALAITYTWPLILLGGAAIFVFRYLRRRKLISAGIQS